MSPPSPRVRFDNGLSGLEALGVKSVSQLLDATRFPVERAQSLDVSAGRVRVRFPLPGTEDERGRLTDRPRGAGTGWVVLERWNGSPWRPLVRARLTRPRSASLAERAWNLFCHLRSAGVGTPQPLAVGAAGGGPVSRNSFLVTRELVGYETPAQWAGRPHRPDARRQAFEALGAFLSNLLGSGVCLPQLTLEQLRISAVAEVEDDAGCDHAPGLQRRRLPGIVLTDVTGGAIRTPLAVSEAAGMLAALVPRDAQVAAPGELARTFLRATRRNFTREERRAIWQFLVAGA